MSHPSAPGPENPNDDRSPRIQLPVVPVKWPALDPGEEAAHLELLGRWLDWLVGRYGLDHRTVPPCWAQHGELIEELSALRTAWERSYATVSAGTAPLAWHESFAAARDRLADWVTRSGCRPDQHRRR